MTLACAGGAPQRAAPAGRAPVAQPALDALPVQRAGQPNHIDLLRLARLLGQRERYRYVTPVVQPVSGGYEIASPNCSRSLSEEGAPIPVARLRYDPAMGWRLFYRDHAAARWRADGDYASLAEAVERVNQDAQRVYWP